MNLANSVPVETPDLVSFRDPPIETQNVTDIKSGGVATSIMKKTGSGDPGLATLKRRQLRKTSKI